MPEGQTGPTCVAVPGSLPSLLLASCSITAVGCGFCGKVLVLVLWATGGTLAEFIQKRCNSLLEEETILHFFVQILLALHHVHTHLILHRDLKTQNILLDKHRMVVKIGDFGISKILSSKSKAYTVPRRAGDAGGPDS